MGYEEIALDIARLVQKKSISYGDSFGKSGAILRILYPVGISHDQMDEALTIVRILDKMFRVANKPDAFGESPWADIIGYGLLAEGRRVKS